ncbi:MAG: hypothetical protein JWP42_4356 [Pseudomonas sp.]|nr:hypothetical protein [Pseudomonas sp.]
MPKTIDTRPLVERLRKRILKKHGGNAVPVNDIAGSYLTDSDSTLHQQAVEEISRLTTENELLTKGEAYLKDNLQAAYEDRIGLRTERDQLKAQVARLTEDSSMSAIRSLRADCEALRKDAELAAKKLRSAEICHPNAVEFLVDEAREALSAYLPKGWPIQDSP